MNYTKSLPRERRVRSHKNALSAHTTSARGFDVLNSPQLNKGTAFTAGERSELGLTGLLPPEISTLEMQVRRAFIQYDMLPDSLGKNVYLTALHDRNEVLFFRLFSEHLREMIPIVNDRTVGVAMQHYHLESRRPRGVYLSVDHPDSIEAAFANFGAGPEDIDLMLATDAEEVLGLGDWGVGGMEVSIGKLAIYTAAGGVDPARVMPVMLDVGTDRESLLNDPMYIGNRHKRVRGEKYYAFIDLYVKTAHRMFPKAIVQWEDLAPGNGRRILNRYRDSICTFSDGILGTGAIVLAATISAIRVCGTPLRNQRIVIVGAGTAGMGIADQLRAAMIREGLSPEAATKRFWLVDKHGLLNDHPLGQRFEYQTSWLRSAAESRSWARECGSAEVSLAEVVHRIHPTILIGTASAPDMFTEAIVRDMAAHTERPIIFSIGLPAATAATPADLLSWTDGRVLMVTGNPSVPVTWKGLTYVIGQADNAVLYPGLVLGAIVSGARLITDGMLAAAANAVSSLVTVRQPGSSLLPHIDDLRSISAFVAVAVAEAAQAEGLAQVKMGDIGRRVQATMWAPEYRPIEAASLPGCTAAA